MPQVAVKELLPPLAGEHAAASIQAQPPFTTPLALNVCRDYLNRRDRTASRPGLMTFAPAPSSHACRMLGVGYFKLADKYDHWNDTFNYSTMAYTALTNYTTSTLPTVSDGVAWTATTARSFALPSGATTDFDSSAAYMLGITIVPYAGSHGATYRILTNSTNYATCHYVKFTIDNDGDWTVNLYERSAGVDGAAVATASGSLGAVYPIELEVKVASGTTTVYLNRTSIASGAMTGGSSFGIAMEADSTYRAQIDRVSLQYYRTTLFDLGRPRMFGIWNGVLYCDSFVGHFAAVSTNLRFATDRNLSHAVFGQKVYIADGSEAVLASGTDGVVSSGGTQFDSASYTDWTLLLSNSTGTDTYFGNFAVVIGNESYVVTARTIDKLTISGATDGSGQTWKLVRCAKVYDPVAGTVTYWSTSGGAGNFSPTGAAILTTHGGRIYAGGFATDFNEIRACTIGNPLDWIHGTEAGDAFTLSASDKYGIIQGGVRAMLSAGSDVLLIGTATAMFRQIGDPTSGGQLLAVSNTLGAAGAGAMCFGEATEKVYVLTPNDGIYAMQINCPSCNLVRLSGKSVPKEMQDIPLSTPPAMVFDVEHREVVISLTPKAASAAAMPVPVHWAFDVDNNAYYRRTHGSNNYNPLVSVWYPGTSGDDNCVVHGTYGGALLRIHDRAENDCGTTITNYVLLGPFMLGRGGIGGGSLDYLAFNFDVNSGAATWYAYVGRSASEALTNALADSYVATGTIPAGSTPDVDFPVMNGSGYGVVKIVGGSRWFAMESTIATIADMGVLR